MPEGHTVHGNARDLFARFGGQDVVVSSPQRRFDDGAALLDGRELTATDAHGKHLFARFGADRFLHVHLGLYGRWTWGDGVAEPPRGLVRVRLEAEGGWADLRGPTACDVLDPESVAAVHARLGPDPLRSDAEPSVAYTRIARSKVAIGALLMQQEVVAGVGAVYRAESLFRAGINPYRPGRQVSPPEWDALWKDLVVLLRAGLKAGRIVTTRPVHRVRATGRATRGDSFYVYRRTGEPCRVCGTPIAYAQMVARHLQWDALWKDLVVLLRAGLKAGRIVTTRPVARTRCTGRVVTMRPVHRVRATGRATRGDSFYVYRRTGEPCRVCGTPIAYARMVARHLQWCPTCQGS